MAQTKQQRIEKNLLFIREQLSRYLYKHFKKKLEYKLYANKDLKKQRRFSKITFPESKTELVEVDVEYETVVKGRKQELLDIAFRSAIRIGMWQTGRPYKDGHPEVVRELEKAGLKNYGFVPEMGMDLHTYQCSKCKRIYALQEKKLPPSRNPVDKGYKTGCCKEPFEYTGVQYYDNEKLQEILLLINKKGNLHAKRSEKSTSQSSNSFW